MDNMALSQKQASSWKKPPTESALCEAPVVPSTVGEREACPQLCCRAGFIYHTLCVRGTEMLHALKAPFPPVKRDEDPTGASALCV